MICSRLRSVGIRIIVIIALVLGIFPFGGLYLQTQASDLSFRAGVGYELLSQEYFIDTVAFSGPDSVLSRWALSTNYLDDMKAQIRIDWLPYDDRRLQLRGSWDQTNEFVRGRLTSQWRTPAGGGAIDLWSELESKQRYRGEEEFGDSYWQGWTRLKWTRPISDRWSLIAQGRADGVAFLRPADYNYSYYRVGGETGIQWLVGEFSIADAQLFYYHREVPDSIDLNYESTGIQATLFGFMNHGDLDAFLRFENKDYNRPDHRDDHVRLEAQARHNWRFGLTRHFLRQEIEYESNNYHPEDRINFDYGRFEVAVLFGIQTGILEVALGPRWENLAEDEDTLLTGQDYNEYSARADLNLISPPGWFISAESITGRRDLQNENDYRSDYTFERISLITDVDLGWGLNLNLLFSGEWEWHEVNRDDSRIFLLTTSLAYGF